METAEKKPLQTKEERRLYRQRWYQENKARLREKLRTPEGRERCRGYQRKRAEKIKAQRSTPEYRARDNARRRALRKKKREGKLA